MDGTLTDTIATRRGHLGTMMGVGVACVITAALVFAACSGAASAVPSLSLNKGLCRSNASRGAIPASFAVNACFDGRVLYIYNNLDVALGVAVQGDVGKPRRTESDFDLAAVATRKESTDPDLLLPGDELKFPIGSGAARIKLRGTPKIGYYAESRAFETYIPGKSLGVIQAFTAMMKEVDQDARQYATCETSRSRVHRLGCKTLLARNVSFAAARFVVHGTLGVARKLVGKAVALLVGTVELLRWAYDQPQQVKQILRSGVISLAAKQATAATLITRQVPVGADGQIAPGFTIIQRVASGICEGGSDLEGQAYRCFSGHVVHDPCYAVGDLLTGDGVGVVCPLSPFTSNLFAITAATGLSVLARDPSNELYGLTLASGTHCVALEGAHGSDTAGRVLDFACDDNRTYVLRGVHETSPVWIADVAVAGPNYTEVPAGSEAVTSVVLLEHQVPPANRPVVDAGNATVDEFDSPVRVHHEVDCGPTQTVADKPAQEQVFDSQIACADADLIVTEWDNGDALEPGWSCDYDAAGTLLCEQQLAADFTDAPTFFSSAHLRALLVS